MYPELDCPSCKSEKSCNCYGYDYIWPEPTYSIGGIICGSVIKTVYFYKCESCNYKFVHDFYPETKELTIG